MKKKATLAVALLFFCGLFAACGSAGLNSESSGGEGGSGENGSLNGASAANGGVSTTIGITAGPGTQPVYSWTGGNVKEVSVTPTGSTLKVWGISCSINMDCISSPQTQGIIPINTTQTGTATILTAGQSYTVTVVNNAGTAGTATFTP